VKTIWIGVLVTGLFVVTGRAEPSKTARLFIIAGQSNAGGKGVGSDLPAQLKKSVPEVFMFGRHAHDDLRPLEPYGRKGFGDDNTAFGAELVFAREMKKAFPTDIICIAKQTKGGTSIIAWDKDWKRAGWTNDMKLVANEAKGPQYDTLIKTGRDALAALKARPDMKQAELAGVLWIQSERDDHYPKAAAMYGDNLRKLIANLRADFARPELPFLFADANAHRNQEVIHAGMEKVAAELPHTVMVSIAELSRDGVHYDSKGQLELGRRFAGAYLKLIGKGTQ
jgi:hypothetical protein